MRSLFTVWMLWRRSGQLSEQSSFLCGEHMLCAATRGGRSLRVYAISLPQSMLSKLPLPTEDLDLYTRGLRRL